MKKIYLSLIAAAACYTATAQTAAVRKNYDDDSNMPRWVADVNLLGGGLWQNLTMANTNANYLNGVNMNTGNLSFNKGMALGADVQLGFFMGDKRHWGIGTGLLYTHQTGNMNLDGYHVEYQSTDYRGETFRQMVTAGSFTENIKTDNFSIPLLLKYKNRFSRHWGFTADAGPLFNVGLRSRYNTNASFDYEAIYQYNRNADGSLTAVYDAAPTPADRDWLITQSHFVKNNSEGNVRDYFNALHTQGYNVGLGATPARNTGSASATTASVGFMVQPSVNYFFSDRVALNLGLVYAYQPYTNSTANYRLTNNVGDYSSVLNSVSRAETHTFGGNVGIRFIFGKPKDTDHDAVPDRKDDCPNVYGLAKFNGCPDRDRDGIPDRTDSCVTVPGLPQFYGCPDTDGDGIPDKDDLCPTVFGLAQYHGCPDTDGDGIPDNEDLCPTIAGPAIYHGCPDTDGDGVPDNLDKCPTVAGIATNQGCPLDTVKIISLQGEIRNNDYNLSTPILFELNKTIIHKSSHELLHKAAEEMKANPRLRLVIDGHADATGRASYNNTLSLKRANAVKTFLAKLGVDPARIRTVGHGSKQPAATNKTAAGRGKNRRAVMSRRGETTN